VVDADASLEHGQQGAYLGQPLVILTQEVDGIPAAAAAVEAAAEVSSSTLKPP
jgi:hypothetical protein